MNPVRTGASSDHIRRCGKLVDSSVEDVGSAVSEFQVGSLIGEGGQAQVFQAVAPNGQTVALKRFKPPENATAPTMETAKIRFRREVQITSSLTHRNIVEILSDNLKVDAPYYYMPWAEARLSDIIAQYPNGMAAQPAIDLFVEICQGMAYAHRSGVLHRDLNPRNILIFSGIPKVADFGLGRSLESANSTLTQSHMGWGTMHYMAPEQMTALHLADKRADVFSLGVILFQLVTGLQPHLAKMRIDHVPAELRFIVTKCLADSPADRFEDAEQLLQALQRAQTADASKQAPPKQRAEAAVGAFKAGVPGAIEELADILHSNPADSQLYRNFLPTLTVDVLRKLPHLNSIIKHYDNEFATENATFAYTDTIATFYGRCLEVVSELDTRLRILNTLLRQAADNNRFFAGDEFAKACNAMWTDPVQAELIADVLRANRDTHSFIEYYLNQYSMPAAVRAALTVAEESPTHDSETGTAPWAKPADDPWGVAAKPDPWGTPSTDPWATPETRDPWDQDPFS